MLSDPTEAQTGSHFVCLHEEGPAGEPKRGRSKPPIGSLRSPLPPPGEACGKSKALCMAPPLGELSAQLTEGEKHYGAFYKMAPSDEGAVSAAD